MTAPASPLAKPFRITLWTKLVLFTTVIVVATCSLLGWFFIRQHALSVTEGLIDSGTLLAKHLAVKSRYSILLKDHTRLREHMAGLLDVEHVAYVIVRSWDGRLLGNAGDDIWTKLLTDERAAASLPASPPPASSPSAAPTVRQVFLNDHTPQFGDRSQSLGFDRMIRLVLGIKTAQPSYFDIAVPVLSQPLAYDNDPALNLTLQETRILSEKERSTTLQHYGTIHIGLSDAHKIDQLRAAILQGLFLTATIIVLGIVGVLLLARRITTPIKSLTEAAGQLAEGGYSARAASGSSDEIGDLTRVFNEMASSLEHHEEKLQEINHSLEARVQARTDELQRTNRRLQELDLVKTALVSSASHELRTPITAMAVHLSNLLDGVAGPITPSQGETVRRIHENAARLRRMIDDLLDLSRLQGRRAPFEPQPLPLDRIVHDALAVFLEDRTQKQISIQVDMPASLPCVWGDDDKLRQVFANLIHNAVKFSPPGAGIRVTAERSGSGVTVCIADFGCGIPSEEIDRIFLPFYRCSNGAHARGSGLGLSIVKELVDLHGGTVRVESSVGHGSRFFVDLPIETRS